MNVVVEIQRINESELRAGVSDSRSWHARYRDSAWVYVGGLDGRLTEGDITAVLSQFGEVEDAHLVRDEASGASRGFAFIKYEDWRSTVLAVDNLTGAELLGRTLRVDHKAGGYEPPKSKKGSEAQLAAEAAAAQGHVRAFVPGAAYVGRERAGGWDVQRGVNLWAPARGAEAAGEINGSVVDDYGSGAPAGSAARESGPEGSAAVGCAAREDGPRGVAAASMLAGGGDEDGAGSERRHRRDSHRHHRRSRHDSDEEGERGERHRSQHHSHRSHRRSHQDDVAERHGHHADAADGEDHRRHWRSRSRSRSRSRPREEAPHARDATAAHGRPRDD